MKKQDEEYSFLGTVVVGGVITTLFISIMSIASKNDDKMMEFYKTHELTYVEHVVEEGETIRSISKKYNCAEELIINDNDINNPDYIVPGQILYIEQYVPIETYEKTR
jgi:LysM repeat protein